MIPVTAEQFRQVMRRWASTVNIVTTRHEGFDYGLTVTAFSSLAATPPLVFASINTHTRTPVSYTHLRAHETVLDLVCRLLLEKKKDKLSILQYNRRHTRYNP